MTLKVGILASGNASAGQSLYWTIENYDLDIEISWIGSDKQDAFCLKWAETRKIPFFHCPAPELASFISRYMPEPPDFVLLSGYMRHISPETLAHFKQNRILNVHPADTKKYGGAGMYGDHVYDAVEAAKDTSISPTLHYVDAGLDTGDPVCSIKIDGIDKLKTRTELKRKVQGIEGLMVSSFFYAYDRGVYCSFCKKIQMLNLRNGAKLACLPLLPLT